MNTSKNVFVGTAFVAASLALLPAFAQETLSSAVPVERNPEKSFLWHTAPTNTFVLRWVKPQGATSATLNVTGTGYSQSYENLTGDSLSLSLPPAASASDERVYQLVLTFDDDTVLRTTLGVVSTVGVSSASAMSIGDSTRAWGRSGVYPVLPVPCGVERLEVDGVTTDTGLDGDAGWFYFNPVGKGEHSLLVETAEGVREVELVTPGGSMIIVM